MSVTKQLMDPIDFHGREKNIRRKRFIQVWKNLRVRKWKAHS